MAYVSGKIVCSIDGWLGFFCGHSDGFLAFISAYMIYKNDQKQKEKRTLLLRPSSFEDKPTDAYLIYSDVESDIKGKLHFQY